MKVKTVSVNIRFSKALEDKNYKTIELGAEATLDSNDNWQEAQSNLYQELGQQLKNLWIAKTDGETRINNRSTQSTNDENTRSKTAPTVSDRHMCSEHNVDYKRFEKNGKSWYAHKSKDGWCNEK